MAIPFPSWPPPTRLAGWRLPGGPIRSIPIAGRGPASQAQVFCPRCACDDCRAVKAQRLRTNGSTGTLASNEQ
eukprot:607384-Lingulodinium_polyedra.AAC.1